MDEEMTSLTWDGGRTRKKERSVQERWRSLDLGPAVGTEESKLASPGARAPPVPLVG